MGLRTTAALAGLLGGLAWLAALVLDRTVGGGIVDALTWVGLALVGVATLGGGAGLVSRSATWLRVLVAVCFAVLVWSVLQVLSDAGDERVVYAVCGVAAGIVSVIALARSRPAERPVNGGHRARGTHVR